MPDGYVLSDADRRYVRNSLRQLLAEYTSKTRRLESVLGRGGGVPAIGGRIRFRNDNAGTVPAHGCLRITGMATVKGKPILTIDQPNTTFGRLYLVNGQNQVATGKTGWGYFLMGDKPRKVLYDTGTPAYGESWGPKASQWSLAKWRYGFTILGSNDTTALTTHAAQHVVNHFIGKTDASHAKSATGTISVYDGNRADTSMNVTDVYNLFAAVATTKWVDVEWRGGTWYLTAAEC